MSNWKYDSGGKDKDPKKYRENYDKIFEAAWPCPECGGQRSEGHKSNCSRHWKNK